MHNIKTLKQCETEIPDNISMEIFGQEKEGNLRTVSVINISSDMKNTLNSDK